MKNNQPKLHKLTTEAFAPFGDLLDANTVKEKMSINGGQTLRINDLAKLEHDSAGKMIVSIFRASPLGFPFEVKLFEKHPKGSQLFFPLSGNPYLVCVSPGEATPTLESLLFFWAEPHQGINFRLNQWHHPLMALQGPSDFLVVDRAGPGENCDFYHFPSPLILERPSFG